MSFGPLEMTGAFITLEGIEGVGKSTALNHIAHRLTRAGLDVVVTREPGGTALGEMLRDWVLQGDHGPLSAEVEALLMFAARAQHLNEIIKPALSGGRWVVCDRFTDATLAYQGGGRGAGSEFLHGLKRAVQGELEPDLTFLLDAPVEVGMARIADRAPDHFEKEGRGFFDRVRRSYLRLAEMQPGRIKLVDANRPMADVERDLSGFLDEFLKGRDHLKNER